MEKQNETKRKAEFGRRYFVVFRVVKKKYNRNAIFFQLEFMW